MLKKKIKNHLFDVTVNNVRSLKQVEKLPFSLLLFQYTYLLKPIKVVEILICEMS